MTKKFTLISVVVVMFGLGIMFLSGHMVPRNIIKNKVVQTAEKYCDELSMDYIGGSTPGTDSDGDGYVSIDARCKDKDTGKVERINLECSWSMVGFPTGCKEKVSIRNQSNKS